MSISTFLRRTHLIATTLAMAATLAAITLGPAPLAAQATQSNADAPTLYQRLGGYDFIARFVDTAFPRVAAEPTLARLFRGHSLDSQMRQRQLIVDALCKAAGGPCLYTGRDMAAVHRGLAIDAADWRAFIEVISRTLDELVADPALRADFLRLFESRFRAAVVTP
jgi:hemoglobin